MLENYTDKSLTTCAIEPSENGYAHVIFNSEIILKYLSHSENITFYFTPEHSGLIKTYLSEQYEIQEIVTYKKFTNRIIKKICDNYDHCLILSTTPKSFLYHILFNKNQLSILLHSLVGKYNVDTRFRILVYFSLKLRKILTLLKFFNEIHLFSQVSETGKLAPFIEEVITHGLLNKYLQPKESKSDLKRLVFIGEMNPKKNIETFFKLGDSKYKDLDMVVISSNPETIFSKRIEILKIKRSDLIIDYLKPSDIVFCHYDNEFYKYTFSATLIEAISAGCQVIIGVSQLKNLLAQEIPVKIIESNLLEGTLQFVIKLHSS